MKVLHLETGMHLYGGAQQVAYLLDGLRRKDMENVLVCPSGSAIATALTNVDAVREIPMRGDLDLGFVLRFRRLIRKERLDIVHVHSRRGADTLGGLAARSAGVRAVLSRRVDNPERNALGRLKYRLYSRVITISEGIRQVLLSEGVPATRLVCVKSAVDRRLFQPKNRDDAWFRKEFRLPEGAPVLGMVAQFIERKGHHVLLEALPKILDTFPDSRVLLFGKGPLETEVIQAVHERGLDATVRFAGFRDDLPNILCCLDAVVHPALKEGLGVSLLQAASSAVPIVGTDTGGIPEIVRDGENGLLIPPNDPDALATAVGRLLADPVWAGILGARGRAIVNTEFSVSTMVDGNYRVYEQILE